MSRAGPAFGHPHGSLLVRLFWPAVALFVAALWVVLAGLLWSVETLDGAAIDRQRQQLASALDAQLGTLATQLAGFAPLVATASRAVGIGADPWGTVEERLLGARDFDGLLVVRSDWRPVVGAMGSRRATADSAARLRALFEELADEAGHDVLDGSGKLEGERASRRLVASGRDVYAAAAVALAVPSGRGADGSDTLLLVGYRTVTPGLLEQIGTPFGLSGFAVNPRGAGGPAALALPGPDGSPAALLTWSAHRPGDLLRGGALPLACLGLAVAAALFAAVAAGLHRAVRDLAATEARSRDLIGRDPLSGLANRLLFGERLDEELKRIGPGQAGLAVMFIDLDRFKDVNDSHGHQAGDDLIRLVGMRLTSLVRTSDTIARFGGDEFAVIQTGIRSTDDSAALARRILEALTRPFVLDGAHVLVGASIGIALAPAHADHREVLMGLADTALYQAKSGGRNRFVFFESRMDETIRMRKTVEEDLRRAIAEDQLVLHYQPLFSADGKTVVALEALVRWPHPVRGLIPPSDFIPIAEERGLVIPLGEWVLRRACLDGLRWPGLRIAVNVSPVQFRHRDFVQNVTTHLAETGFDPSRLELELTEGVVVDDADAAEAAMIELRALGVHLALDDFGTGYSSLIYLRRFAFDTIKIDRSFLESMEGTGESAILVHSMVHLGRALGLTVTAEGVETDEQHRFLQALGCHQLQGYLFSRPLPSEQVDELLGLGKPAAAAM